MQPIYHSLEALFNDLPLKDGLNISFHHHLRNGDATQNLILSYLRKQQLNDLNLYPSAIFPVHTELLTLLKEGRVKNITTNYINGPVAEFLASNPLPGQLKMQTHGGRARAIIKGETTIDIAFIAAPIVDAQGNAAGYDGPSACGSLGYAIEDSQYAKKTVLITDHRVEKLPQYEIKSKDVDAILCVDSLGNREGIVSGTTAITKDPVGLKIANNAARLIDELKLVKPGMNFQSGAGGISLKVTDHLREMLRARNVKAGFFSGGITQSHVEMLNEGLVERLYDVQCFDLAAIQSLKTNPSHIAISASDYANPDNQNRVIKNLDLVILGATEIDLNFNVNVTTDSYNTIIGGSGGHSDTATDSFVSLIVTPLFKARTPIIKKRVNTITTRGKNIDILVTERGIAINPLRLDLLDRLKESHLPIYPIEALLEKAYAYTGIPQEYDLRDQPLGVVEDRDGQIIDTLYTKKRR